MACGIFSRGMRARSSSLTRDRSRAPCIGSAESYPLDHQGSPFLQFLKHAYTYMSSGVSES